MGLPSWSNVLMGEEGSHTVQSSDRGTEGSSGPHKRDFVAPPSTDRGRQRVNDRRKSRSCQMSKTPYSLSVVLQVIGGRCL